MAAMALWTTQRLNGALSDMSGRTLPSVADAYELHAHIGRTVERMHQSFAWERAEFPAGRIAKIDQEVLSELGTIKGLLAEEAQNASRDPATTAQFSTALAAFDK